ncbi:MAG: translation elongation factor Ts [bacterium]|nr:translation elongation factor Ts [bacterium]
MEVTAQMVKELRGRTGAGIMDCKEALREKNGDVEEAIRYLRESGLLKAAKKAGREASDGQVSALVADDGKSGVLVEVNCETDFVARTDDFQALVSLVAGQVMENGPENVCAEGGPVQTAITAAIAKLGENVLFGRAARFALDKGVKGKIVSYIHPGGRIGVLVELKGEGDGLALEAVGRDMAMHIAASRPSFIDEGGVPGAVLESEREILLAQQKDTGKPQEILAKIVEGRLKKYLQEICLLDQPFVKDPDQTVGAVLAAKGKEIGGELAVTRFVRFELGEGMEQETAG